jgi:hypothetical protein
MPFINLKQNEPTEFVKPHARCDLNTACGCVCCQATTLFGTNTFRVKQFPAIRSARIQTRLFNIMPCFISFTLATVDFSPFSQSFTAAVVLEWVNTHE